MGNNKIRHTLHRRSNVGNLVTIDIERDSLEVIKPKSPTPENIEYGEIAINFGKDYEGMFIKNSENEIIQLNTVEHLRYDGKIDESLEQYLDDRFVNRSGDTIYGSITIQADEKHPEYNDDPVFKYIGSEFDVSAKTSALSGETLSVIENEVTTDIEKAKTEITNHTYSGNTIDADVITTDFSGETLDMHVVDASYSGNILDVSAVTATYSGKTLTFDILGSEEKCDAILTVNSNNITTHVDCLMNTEVNGNSELAIKGDYTVSVSGDTNFTCTATTTTTIGTHDYNVTNLDADVKYANLSGDTLYVTERETNINSTESLNITGTTTKMEGDTLNIDYKNINLSAETNNNTITNQTNHITNQTNEFTTVNTTATTVNETINDWNVTATTALMSGDTLNFDYNTINISGDTTNIEGDDLNINYTTIDTTASTSNTIVNVENKTATTVNNTVTTQNDYITNWNAEGDTLNFDYKNINLSAETTVFEGDVLNEIYNTINRKATTINDSATTYNISSTTENHYSTSTNFYGDVNISKDFHVSGDSIFEGDVIINGNLFIPEGKTIDGDLDNPLYFRVIKSGVSTKADAIDDYSYYNQGETGLTVNNILASKDYVDEMYALLLDDSGMTETIDSFKELKEVLGKDSSDVDSTYGTVIEAINKRVFRSGDTMTGDLNIVNNSTINLSTAGTITAKSNIKSNGVFVGELEKTISFADGMFSAKSFNNSADVTINIPSQTTLDDRYVNNSGDTMSGNLKITSGGLNVTGNTSVSGTVSATGNISTNGSFVGDLDKTLTFESGTFSGKSFDNSSDVTVKIPTDLSHLSCTGAPSSWTAMDKRYVNVTGDTMTGALNISSGGLSVTGNTTISGTVSASSAIYSSDIVLKTDIESVSENDIKLVSGIDLKSYKFKDDETNRERYGVIAQDLEAANLNHLVVESESGIKGVDYISFLILKIAQLEKEIKELKSKK